MSDISHVNEKTLTRWQELLSNPAKPAVQRLSELTCEFIIELINQELRVRSEERKNSATTKAAKRSA